MTDHAATSRTDNIRSLDILRGIAVLLMVFMHATAAIHAGEILSIYNSLNGAATSLRMPVLFLISGMLSIKFLSSDFTVVARRFVQLMWLYILWVPINLLDQLTLERWWQELAMPLSVMWFILMLALLVLSIPAVKRIPRVVVLVTTIVAGTVSFKFELPIYSYNNFLRYMCFFYAGLLYRREIERLFRMIYSYVLLVILCATYISIHVGNAIMANAIGWSLLGIIERFAACLLGLYGVRLLDRIEPIAFGLQWVGKRTLPIYVAHSPIIAAVALYWPQLTGEIGPIAPILVAIAAAAMGLYFFRMAHRLHLGWLYRSPDRVTAWSAGLMQNAVSALKRVIAPSKLAPAK